MSKPQTGTAQTPSLSCFKANTMTPKITLKTKVLILSAMAFIFQGLGIYGLILFILNLSKIAI